MNKQYSPLPTCFLIVIILFALVIFMVTSCVDRKTIDEQVQLKRDLYGRELDSTSEYSDRAYRTYTLEDCEYIVVGMGNFQWGSHKGNCKNPMHKQDGR
jgi:hypothetical protein